jgi:hypothetical protein
MAAKLFCVCPANMRAARSCLPEKRLVMAGLKPKIVDIQVMVWILDFARRSNTVGNVTTSALTKPNSVQHDISSHFMCKRRVSGKR